MPKRSKGQHIQRVHTDKHAQTTSTQAHQYRSQDTKIASEAGGSCPKQCAHSRKCTSPWRQTEYTNLTTPEQEHYITSVQGAHACSRQSKPHSEHSKMKRPVKISRERWLENDAHQPLSSLESSTHLAPFNKDTMQFSSKRRYFFTRNLQLLADTAHTGWLSTQLGLDPTPDEA